MFQDYDNEVLCSILFEQCNGDLDKSIQSILQKYNSLLKWPINIRYGKVQNYIILANINCDLVS